VDAGLTAYRDLLRTGPAFVVGDLNSHWRWDAGNKEMTHGALVARLDREFGLVSAYHAARPRVAHGSEEPTLYWQWKREQPFHIDYCFLPRAWVPRIASVTVGSFDEWSGKSDHRPLVVELSADPSTRSDAARHAVDAVVAAAYRDVQTA
jgi:endonuclease/exonuclease/phosphatase family metal-dependent hydrolase